MRYLVDVKDFIVVEDMCQFCARIKIAFALSLNEDIDIIDIFSGDPRVKIVENIYGGGDIYVPTGIVKKTLINGSRDVHSMMALFGGDV